MSLKNGSTLEVADLTPIERQIFEALSDRRPHTKKELYKCLEDPDGALPNTVEVHVCRLRSKVEKIGLVIYCRSGFYTMIPLPS